MLNNFRHIHFIGIGGSGISSLAYLALSHGLKVSGSDIGQNATTKHLEKEGAQIFVGHKIENLGELVELVIYSEAIDKESNPEYKAALEKGLQKMSYFEALGLLSSHKKTIVVAGTHGKTTTTAMLGQAMIEAGLDPTVIVGAPVSAFNNRNIHMGKSEYLVAEACEYRRSFLSFEPHGMILLNCELEHIDYYKSEEDYVAAYSELVAKLPKDGFLVYNATDNNVKKIADTFTGKKIAVDTTMAKGIELSVPGDFNQLNAAHALSAALQLTDNQDALRKGLLNFHGTAHRMEIKGEKEGVLVIDDYGHHPTEVRATLGALKEAYPDKRIICVFQPHQYSRTNQLRKEFSEAFTSADQVIIPNIFEARDTEEDKASISAEELAKEIPNAKWGKDFPTTLELLKTETKAGDLVVTMGAGDVYRIGESYLS